MGVGGLSDPYVLVTADPVGIVRKEVIRSSHIPRTCNPDWKDESIVFHLRTIDIEGLADFAHLFLSVWDNENTGADNLIGSLAIPLKDIIDAYLQGSSSYTFSDPLYSKALKQGELSGTIKLLPIISKVGRLPSAHHHSEDTCCAVM